MGAGLAAAPKKMRLLLSGRLVGSANLPSLLPDAANLVHGEKTPQLHILD
jgi:hypothetical protein